jgi:TolB-like protein/Tfp pilus assembly protein PilF
MSYLKVNPAFERLNLTSDPRYKELLRKIGLAKPSATVPMIEPSPSIAVLPFVNMSADPEQEYFCDGLAEELINALTQIMDLKVIARTSAFSFKGKNVNVRDIGRELDVGSILEGSVRKAGNRIRITAQLVNTESGHHLWSEKYDRDMEDIFAIQDEITETIVDKLKPKLLGEEQAKPARSQTVDLEAYNLYLQGRWFLGKSTASGLKKAISCFEKSIEKSQDYALAYSGLADSYFFLPYFMSAVPKETYPKARETALKALEIDDTVAEAHASLAQTKAIYEWDWEGADKSMRRAIELNPGYALAHHQHAMILMFRGRFNEAIEEINRAVELDPLSITANRDAGTVFLFARQPDQAIEMFRHALEMDPNYGGMHSSLGAAYWFKSMYEEAIAEFEKEKKIASGFDPVVEHYLGVINTLTGRTEEARKVLEKMEQRSKTDYFPGSLIAVLSFALGEIDKGFEWLEKAYEQHDNWLAFVKVNPIFEMLDVCSDPRYTAMLKKMNLEP